MSTRFRRLKEHKSIIPKTRQGPFFFFSWTFFYLITPQFLKRSGLSQGSWEACSSNVDRYFYLLSPSPIGFCDGSFLHLALICFMYFSALEEFSQGSENEHRTKRHLSASPDGRPRVPSIK